jgi:hypothetical protein
MGVSCYQVVDGDSSGVKSSAESIPSECEQTTNDNFSR